jgi:hypothetical protein
MVELGAFLIAAAWMIAGLAVVVALVREVVGRLTGRGPLGWRVWLAVGLICLATTAAGLVMFSSAHLAARTVTYAVSGTPGAIGGAMDEAIERLVDLIIVREGVSRKEAELILLNLLGELERLLDRVPPHALHLTRIVPLDGPDPPT